MLKELTLLRLLMNVRRKESAEGKLHIRSKGSVEGAMTVRSNSCTCSSIHIKSKVSEQVLMNIQKKGLC